MGSTRAADRRQHKAAVIEKTRVIRIAQLRALAVDLPEPELAARMNTAIAVRRLTPMAQVAS